MTRPTAAELVTAHNDGYGRFRAVTVSTRYVSHPTTGQGQIEVRILGRVKRVPFDHQFWGLNAHRAAVAEILPGFEIEHSPDVVTGYRFLVWPTPAPEPGQ